MVGFPGGSDGKESACNMRDLGLIPVLGRSPGGGMATHSSILAGTEERGGLHSHGQKNMMAYSLRSCKELDMTEHPAME